MKKNQQNKRHYIFAVREEKNWRRRNLPIHNDRFVAMVSNNNQKFAIVFSSLAHRNQNYTVEKFEDQI